MDRSMTAVEQVGQAVSHHISHFFSSYIYMSVEVVGIQWRVDHKHLIGLPPSLRILQPLGSKAK